MSAFSRFWQRVWHLNGEYEFRRQLKVMLKHMGKIKPRWDRMTNEQRLDLVDRDPRLKAGFAYYKALHNLLHGKDLPPPSDVPGKPPVLITRRVRDGG